MMSSTLSSVQRAARFASAILVLFLFTVPAHPQTLSVDSPSADAGTVPRGTPITKAFVVKNTGSAELQIIDVKPACACTLAKFDKKIAPGATGNIILTIDTKSFRGAISKSADVLSNDPINPSTKLIVIANVKGYVTALGTGSLRIQGVAGEAAAAAVALVSDSPDFKPSTATTNAAYLRATLSPESPSRWRLMLIADATTPVGPVSGSVTVQTGIPQEPTVLIPVTGVVRIQGASTEPTNNAEPALTNEAVVKLVTAGLADEVVIAKVKSAASVQFDLTTDSLLSLKDQKVSGAVVAAMIERAAEKPKPAASTTTTATSSDASPSSPCTGIELMGLYKNEIFDRAMGGGIVEWLAQVRNTTSITKIVAVGWIDQYGQQQRAQVQIKGGDIARPRLDLTKARYIAPVRELRLLSCE